MPVTGLARPSSYGKRSNWASKYEGKKVLKDSKVTEVTENGVDPSLPRINTKITIGVSTNSV